MPPPAVYPGARPKRRPAPAQGDGRARASAASQGDGRGPAPAASRGDVSGVIASMNIGAGEEDSFRGVWRQEVFGSKLLRDIRWMIENGAEIIILQEVSKHWAGFLPDRFKDWGFWRAGSAKVVTMYKKGAAARPADQS